MDVIEKNAHVQEQIRDAVLKNAMFNQLDDKEVDLVIDAMFFVRKISNKKIIFHFLLTFRFDAHLISFDVWQLEFYCGHIIAHAGEEGQNFYVIASGEVECLIGPNVVKFISKKKSTLSV